MKRNILMALAIIFIAILTSGAALAQDEPSDQPAAVAEQPSESGQTTGAQPAAESSGSAAEASASEAPPAESAPALEESAPPGERPDFRSRARDRGALSRPPMVLIGGPKPAKEQVVSRKVRLVAMVTGGIKAPVMFYCDGALIGTAASEPYRTEWDSTKVKDGLHTLRAAAVNEKGEQLWQAEVRVNVDNKNAPPIGPSSAGPGPRMGPTPPLPGERPIRGPAPGSNGTASPPAPPAGPVLEIYRNAEYGISLQYPSGWKVSDHTRDMKPKWNGGFWLVFNSPGEKPAMTINLRHRKLEKPTTSENYVKYNPYLEEWEKTEVSGRPAFQTTQGSAETKRVVHRVLIVDGQHIWMLNCIDETGGDPNLSKKTLTDLVKSLATDSGLGEEPATY